MCILLLIICLTISYVFDCDFWSYSVSFVSIRSVSSYFYTEIYQLYILLSDLFKHNKIEVLNSGISFSGIYFPNFYFWALIFRENNLLHINIYICNLHGMKYFHEHETFQIIALMIQYQTFTNKRSFLFDLWYVSTLDVSIIPPK